MNHKNDLVSLSVYLSVYLSLSILSTYILVSFHRGKRKVSDFIRYRNYKDIIVKVEPCPVYKTMTF